MPLKHNKNSDREPSGRQVRRLAIIGDVHAEQGRLAAALTWIQERGADAVICTGDVADGPGSVDQCCALLQEAEVITVRGNHDRWLLEDRVRDIPNAHRVQDLGADTRSFLDGLPTTQTLDTPLGPLLLCHGIGDNDLRKVWPGTQRMGVERSPELDDILASGEVRFVVNGHMHYRVLIDFSEVLLINAGTLTARHRPGISLVDFATGVVTAHEFDRDEVGPSVAAHPLASDTRRVWRDTQDFDGTWSAIALYGPDLS